MITSQVLVERRSLVSSKPFAEVAASLEKALGHPDIREFWKKIAAARTSKELVQIVQGAVGPSGFMEFTQFNHGRILQMEQGKTAPKMIRLVVGNPLIMKEMAKLVPDAGSYAPVTILIDERDDGVHLSYDTMASYLGGYGDSAALKVAHELDAAIENLLSSAAR